MILKKDALKCHFQTIHKILKKAGINCFRPFLNHIMKTNQYYFYRFFLVDTIHKLLYNPQALFVETEFQNWVIQHSCRPQPHSL